MSRSSANLAASSNAVGPFFWIFKASGQVKRSEAAVSLLMHIAAGLQQHLARVDLTFRPSPFNLCLCSPLTASLPWQSQHDRSLQQGAAVDSQHLFAWCLSELLRPSDHFLYLFIPRAKKNVAVQKQTRHHLCCPFLRCSPSTGPGQPSSCWTLLSPLQTQKDRPLQADYPCNLRAKHSLLCSSAQRVVLESDSLHGQSRTTHFNYLHTRT